MADRPISSLPVASSVSDNDFLIVNKNDTETRKISMANFGGVSGFAPMFLSGELVANSRTSLMEQPGSRVYAIGQNNFIFDGNGNPVTDLRPICGENEMITKTLNNPNRGKPGDIGAKPGDIVDLFKSIVTFTLPQGADSAVIIFRNECTAANGTDTVVGSTIPMYSRGGLRFNISASSGTLFPANGQNKNNVSAAWSIAWPQSSSVARRYDRKNLVKPMSLTGTSGGTITMTMIAQCQDTMRLKFYMGLGQWMIWPYSSANTTAVDNVNEYLFSTFIEEEEEIKPIAPEEYARATQEDFVNRITNTISAIKVSRDCGFRSDGSAWTSDQTDIMDQAIRDLYNLKYSFSGTSGELEQEIDTITIQLAADVPELKNVYNLSDAQLPYSEIPGGYLF